MRFRLLPLGPLPLRLLILTALGIAMLAALGSTPAVFAHGEEPSASGEGSASSYIPGGDSAESYTDSTTISLQSASGGAIACELKANHPHFPSKHAPTRINQSSFVRCSDPVYIIKVTTILQRQVCVWKACFFINDTNADPGIDKKNGKSFLKVHSNKECSPGLYRGKARQYVLAYKGGRPDIRTGYSFSARISC